MFLPLYFIVGLAFIFYVLIPVIGGLTLRGSWRVFRRRVALLNTLPRLSYKDTMRAAGDQALMLRRIYGRLEAFEGKDRIWIQGGNVSAIADLSETPFYILKSASSPDSGLRRISWRAISSLAEGAKIFAAGPVVLENGMPVFKSIKGESIIAVCHELDESELLPRLIADGRSTNELWTPLSLTSIMAGIALTGIALGIMPSGDTLLTVRVLALLVAVLPVLLLAPPGLFLFMAYRILWRKGLAMRIYRDIARLPLRRFERGSDEAKLPDGGRYIQSAAPKTERRTEGSRVFVPPAPIRGRKTAVAFRAENSDDPAALDCWFPSDPESTARQAAMLGYMITAEAFAALALALGLNYILAFTFWRIFL